MNSFYDILVSIMAIAEAATSRPDGRPELEVASGSSDLVAGGGGDDLVAGGSGELVNWPMMGRCRPVN